MRESDCKQPRGGKKLTGLHNVYSTNVKLLLFQRIKSVKFYSSNNCLYWDCIFVRFMLISFHCHMPFVSFLWHVRVESLASSYR